MRTTLLAASLTFAFAGPLLAEGSPGAPPLPKDPGRVLDAYVHGPREGYRWAVQGERALGAVSVVDVELVSGMWRGRPWTHRLRVLVPPPAAGERARPGHAILAITGSGRAEQLDAMLAPLAQQLGVPVAVLFDVPNQPLFQGEEGERGLREDALIAKSFAEFARTGDAEWPLLLPMTRAAVAAMDALEALSVERAKGAGWAHGKLEKFVTTGASKRGWTTWLTAAVDPRVIGIAPIVYDNLNIPAQIRRHFEVWGKPSPQIHDYTDRGLLEMLRTERGQDLLCMVDPFSYVDRIRVPKMALMGTNDTYWPLDAVNLYRGALEGDFFCHYVPNAGHSAGVSVVGAIAGFFDHVTGRTPRLPEPSITVRPRKDATISVAGPLDRARVVAARVWSTSVAGRDFTKAQWEFIPAAAAGAAWRADLPASVGAQRDGGAAFIGELELRDSAGGSFKLHTPVQVWELGPSN